MSTIDSTMQSKIDSYIRDETDHVFKDEVHALQERKDYDELFDRFYTELEFGTGGIRGIIGGGTNRLNPLVVQRVSTGWAAYLVKQFPDIQIKVVLAYDSRHYSVEFAALVSQVLCSYGIKVYYYSAPRPTPQLSFSIRAVGAQSGMVITASHNPPQYNGLKIYWNDGAQIVSPHDTGILESIKEVQAPFRSISLEEASKMNLYEDLVGEMDEKFQDYASALVLEQKTLEQNQDYKIVYTPLHGTGAVHIEALFKQHRIPFVIEPSQAKPDGDFPTVDFPNPEVPAALKNAVATAKKEGANLVLATDPDADRVGVAERLGDDFFYLTGNQIGSLLLHYIASKKHEQGILPKQGVFINTFVTSNLQEKIAQSYGISTIKTYTGFKNIAKAMSILEKKDALHYVFSCEESYGYLPSTAVRDKDGISICLLCADMAKFYASQKQTLVQKLEELFVMHGYHEERTINKHYLGKKGKDAMNAIMHKLREQSPRSVGTQNIVRVEDYLQSVIYDLQNDKKIPIDEEATNMLIFETDQGNRICIRPSGTEPKIKLYLLYSLPKEKSRNSEEAKSILGDELNVVEKQIGEWLS